MAIDNRVLTVGLTVVAVVAVATTRPAGPPAGGQPLPDTTQASATGAGPAVPALADSTPESGRGLLRRFFGEHWKAASASDSFAFGVLIATLPDPYDSHLDYTFDAQLEAIRRAFETSGYVIDRFWLPGARDSVGPVKGPNRVPTREVRPGVMLFRRGGPGSRTLQLLYLVPELATGGIYKQALWTALEERESLLRHPEGPLRPDSAGPIRIIGPAFSGTALSLRFTLRAWLNEHAGQSVEIVSGAATSRTNRETLSGPGIRFSATINTDQSLDSMLATVVLPRLGVEPSQVALLQESSTQYGQGLLDQNQFVVIPFPMSISSLRTEYQRVPGGQAAGPALPGVSEAPRLPLDLLDPARPREDLPVTSRLSPLALDLLLDDVARTLVRHRIRLVGLLATDVRDKLFLGDEIRKRVRDVQFFTYENNILYLRADRNLGLRGMLVLSTYPLTLENQWVTSDSSDSRRFAFGSDGSQGVYNATLIQLGNTRALLDYRYRRGRDPNKLALRPPVWLSTVGNRTFLPVAREFLGDSSYVAPGCPTATCPAPGAWPRVSLSFLPVAGMLLASLALLLLALRSLLDDSRLRSGLASHGITSEFEARSVPEQVMIGSLRLHDRLYSLLRLVAVSGIFLAACAPVLPLIFRGRGAADGIFILLASLAAVAATCALAAVVSGAVTMLRLTRLFAAPSWEYFRHGPWTDSMEKWTWRLEVVARGLVVLFGLMYLGLSVGFAADMFGLEPSKYWSFFRRAIEVDSLVSPVLPLVLGGIGYAVWCTWHLQRIALLRDYTTFESVCEVELGAPWASRVSFSAALRDDLHRSAKTVRTIRSRLFHVIPSLGALYLLVAFVWLGVWLRPQFALSLEAIVTTPHFGLPFFDWLFRAIVLASLFATGWGAYRLALVWGGLRDSLTGFGGMPIVSAFDRLPPRLARLTRLTLPALSHGVPAGAVADVQWLHLQRIHAAKKSDFDAALEAGEPGLARRVAELMRAPAAQASTLDHSGRSALVARFRELYAILRALWRLEPMPDDVQALTQSLAKEFDRADPGSGPAASTTVRIRRGFAGPVRLWVRAAEEYAASRMVEYVEWVIHHLRVLALFMLLSLVLTTLMISSYPYQPQSRLRLILLLVLVASVGALIVTLVQMNRNEVLSRIAHTDPGRVTWDTTFILNLFTFGVVPLLTLLSSEFPGLRNALFSWVQPLVGALVKQ